VAERAGALMWAGRLAEAETTCHLLLDREHAPSVEGQAHLLLARTLAAQGRIRHALWELERVQRSPALSDELRAGAWAAEGMARLELGDLDGAVAAAEQARSVSALPGDHPAIGLAMTSLAMVEELRANLRRGLQIIDEAVRLADRSPLRGGIDTRSTWCGETSSWNWTGSRTPGPHSRPAGGSARSSASAGGSPCTRPSWRWRASWPASGTTPSPSSRRHWR
jgi:hypothetical protein